MLREKLELGIFHRVFVYLTVFYRVLHGIIGLGFGPGEQFQVQDS